MAHRSRAFSLGASLAIAFVSRLVRWTVILIGLMGFVTGRPDFLDIALLYALLNFASTIAILRFFSYRRSREAAA